jgi:hypothetical protein
MVIERGRDVHKRLYHLTRIKAERSIWIRYLKSLRRCVWRYSANRCLPLDGKLGNFVDTFPDKMTGSRDEGRVNAIDMDGTYYRRVRRQTAEEGTLDNPASPNMAQGWKLVWLYNILFVSCNLRMILDSTTYFNLWWNDLKGPISAVMIERGPGTPNTRVHATFSQSVSGRAHSNGAEFQTILQWRTLPRPWPRRHSTWSCTIFTIFHTRRRDVD